ncbi:MAG: tetratricopeptide repeat protein, partial [Nitrospiraceae bacterium]
MVSLCGRLVLVASLLTVGSAGAGLAQAQESAEALSAQSLQECDSGRRAKERHVRLAHFENSQSLAEQAVALNDQLADAHFALFCSLGEQLRIDGETMTSVFGVRRVMKELDRTLELNPDHMDALSSKGTFLVRLPALFGGDEQKGEHMLRRVIEREPKAINARLTLAKTYAGRGNRDHAITLAKEALDLAQAEGRMDLIPEAKATFLELQP